MVEHHEYDIAGTACAQVVDESRLVHVRERVIEPHPDDAGLVPLDAVSSLGVPLFDTDDSVMGRPAVLDTEPLPPRPRLLALLHVFAARAAAEQRRMKNEAEGEEQLDPLLAGAMDAILALDDTHCVVRAKIRF